MKRLELVQCKVTGPDTFDLLFGNDVYVIGLGIDPTRQPRTFNLTISKHGKLTVGMMDATLMECIRELSEAVYDVMIHEPSLVPMDRSLAKEYAKAQYKDNLDYEEGL
jgi:hypothetical protein